MSLGASISIAKTPPVVATAYESFLWEAPTALRAARMIREQALAAGMREVSLDSDDCASVRPDDRLVFSFGDRTVILVHVAAASEETTGLAMVGAHLDAPALRVTPNGIPSDRDGAGLSARSFGGVRLSHYANRRLRLIGQVALAGGKVVDLSLGDEIQFVAVEGAATGVSVGETKDGHVVVAATKTDGESTPKAALNAVLAKAIGEKELPAEALAAAELFLVSADRPRRFGLDRKLIGAAGQDDRVLSYALLHAALAVRKPGRTTLALFVDREELGSTGRTGAQAPILEQVTACLARGRGLTGGAVDQFIRRTFAKSQALSTDVKAGLSPIWPEVQDPKNAPLVGAGPTLVKYTGHQGKRNASDAHPELAAQIHALAARHKVPLQSSESGLVDEGGGGTIAKFIAARGIDVIDMGVPILSMHAPLELVHIDDLEAAAALLGHFLSGANP